MTYTIYALIDPHTHEVRYVGQTQRGLPVRFKDHLRNRDNGTAGPVYDWMRSLLPWKPFPVALQHVGAKRGEPDHAAHAAEIKWMKRFERFHLLQFVDRSRETYKRLVNPE